MNKRLIVLILSLGCRAPEAVSEAKQSITGAAPVLFDTAHYQAPVRGGPDALVILLGSNITEGACVSYRRVTGAIPSPPSSVPFTNTVHEGTVQRVYRPADVDSYGGDERSVIARLPPVIDVDSTYALFVADQPCGPPPPGLPPNLVWSAPVLINDPRPLWLTPARLPTSGGIAGLPRTLRIVGRNMQPRRAQRGGRVQPILRLQVDDISVFVTATSTAQKMLEYVAQFDLPTLPAQVYDADVSWDSGATWLDVPENQLEIFEPQKNRPRFKPEDYGCSPLDGPGRDDAVCIRSAIRDASSVGGFVDLGPVPNVWHLKDPTQRCPYPDVSCGIEQSRGGLFVLPGVALVGQGAEVQRLPSFGFNQPTTLAECENENSQYVFTLMGDNEIRGIVFREVDSICGRPLQGAMFALSPWPEGQMTIPPRSMSPQTVDRVVIHDNTIIAGGTPCSITNIPDDAPNPCGEYNAFQAVSRPMLHLVIANNDIRAYHWGLNIGGPDRNRLFMLEDAVIRNNTFWPGAFIRPAEASPQYPEQGTSASVISAARRLDFSGNNADGTESGWRMAYNFQLTNTHEMVLFSQNSASCTSEIAGDGEFFTTDAAGSFDGFYGAQTVSAATANTVATTTLLRDHSQEKPGGELDYLEFWRDHWVVVVDGPGAGQARRIANYSGRPPTITVEPRWDVIPEPHLSRVQVIRGYWSVYAIANDVNDDCGGNNPRVSPSGAPSPQGGVIGLRGPTFDSVVAGNTFTAADGILLHNAYSVTLTDSLQTAVQYGVEVRDNLIQGHYPGSLRGGIELRTNVRTIAPPVSIGVTIANNVLEGAHARMFEPYPTAIVVRAGADDVGNIPIWNETAIFNNHAEGIPEGTAYSSFIFFRHGLETSFALSQNSHDAETLALECQGADTYFDFDEPHPPPPETPVCPLQ